MSTEKLSPFFKVNITSGPGRLPAEDIAYRSSAIGSLMPGDWAIPKEGAVWFDNKAGHHFVDTFRTVEPVIDRNLLELRPLLLRSLGARGVHFVADFRLVTTPTLPYGNSHYGEDGDSSVYRDLQASRGTRVVDAVIFNDQDGPAYDGPDFLVDDAARFMQEVDRIIDGAPQVQEVAVEDQAPPESVMLDLSPSFAHSPVGRAVRGLAGVIDRASQRSAQNRAATREVTS